MKKTLTTPTVTQHGMKWTKGRSADNGPRRMDVTSGLNEALAKQGAGRKQLFPVQSNIVLTVGSTRHGA